MEDINTKVFVEKDKPSQLRINWERMLEEIRESRENFKKVVEEIKESNKANADLKQSLSAIMQETAENEKKNKIGWINLYRAKHPPLKKV